MADKKVETQDVAPHKFVLFHELTPRGECAMISNPSSEDGYFASQEAAHDFAVTDRETNADWLYVIETSDGFSSTIVERYPVEETE